MTTLTYDDMIRFYWEVGDNYVSGKRPQYTEISISYLKELYESGKTLEEIMELVRDEVFYDYTNTVYLDFDEDEAARSVSRLFS